MEKEILEILKKLQEGQERLENKVDGLEQGQKSLEQGQTEIKKEIKFMWGDIKKIDDRLTDQENEMYTIKRIK